MFAHLAPPCYCYVNGIPEIPRALRHAPFSLVNPIISAVRLLYGKSTLSQSKRPCEHLQSKHTHTHAWGTGRTCAQTRFFSRLGLSCFGYNSCIHIYRAAWWDILKFIVALERLRPMLSNLGSDYSMAHTCTQASINLGQKNVPSGLQEGHLHYIWTK